MLKLGATVRFLSFCSFSSLNFIIFNIFKRYTPISIHMKSLKMILFILLAAPVVRAQHVDPNQPLYFFEFAKLKDHQAPGWYNDAKLGIFIHWGLYSVPAFAPTPGIISEIIHDDSKKWFINNAYAEWYLNTLRIKGSPTYVHHLKTYGSDFDYYSFSNNFNEDVKSWSPEKMAETLRMAGARYVVLTTKHHDGFTLWPSRVKNNNMPEACQPVARDVVGELTAAVRAQGMKMGFYYSGGLDWTFTRTPVLELSRLHDYVPQTPEYVAVADAHLRELVEKYRPSILWNDIDYPQMGDLATILSDYYNLIPDGVINNRWGIEGLHDFTTPEYSRYDKIVSEKWESCRGLGYSFGYNRFEDEEHTITSEELVHLLIDVVSKNGNLLINIGPRPDGSIPEIQMSRLTDLGEWMQRNGEAIYDTRPWKTHGGITVSGKEFRYTHKGNKLYVILLERPDKIEEFTDLAVLEGSKLRFLSGGGSLKWAQKERTLEVRFPDSADGKFAYVIEISGDVR